MVDLTVKQCQYLGKGKGIQIPELNEVLHTCENRVGVILDIKEIRSIPELLRLVRKFYFPFPQIALTSFDQDILDRVRFLAPELPCGLTFAKLNQATIDTVKEKSLKFVGVDYKQLKKAELVKQLKDKGAAVFTWNVTSAGDLAAAQELGVNGIAFDDLKLARTLVNQH